MFGRRKHMYRGIDIVSPALLNFVISLAAYSAAIALLIAASRTSWPLRILCAVAFSYITNTIFSLLHESVHRSFNPKRWVNEAMGILSAAFFPTSLSFQRIMHLGHHRRNRTDVEMFDLYYPDDNKLLKFIQWYGILTGFYWLLSPLGCVLYLVCPWALRRGVLRDTDSQVIEHTGADAMLSGLDGAPGLRIRLEIMFTILVHALLFSLLGVSFIAWITCYWAFALNWGALQYADHAWSPRDIRDGAWNLRVNKVVQFIFLNYHHHKAHHQHPHVPWVHLHKFVDFGEHRPSFLKQYLSLWRGPRPAHEGPPRRIDPLFERLIYNR